MGDFTSASPAVTDFSLALLVFKFIVYTYDRYVVVLSPLSIMLTVWTVIITIVRAKN